ncbi:MAG: TIR domain-containing protein [Acetobacteraceae bacterium]|nr:TIR domain-containing protein [Acetobacteraceae bacterium]
MTAAQTPRADHPTCDVFISYARPTAEIAQATAIALPAAGYNVWFDESLPAHRAYAEVIEEHLRAARAVLVLWSGAAAASHWVRAEADLGLKAGKLVQYSIDGTEPPLPFNQIHCALGRGEAVVSASPGWGKLLESIATLVGQHPLISAPPVAAPAKPAHVPATTKPSVAVMPFANITGNPEQDYFADGMVEEIATSLSRIKSLFVIAGSSSRALRDSNISPGEAARRLGVRYMLEGSVRMAGGQVRISLGLIDTEAGTRIWSERFDDTLADVFALQDRVALAVAGVIAPTVQTAEIKRALQRPITDSGSYDLYLRALHKHHSLLEADVREALALLDKSLAIDPENAAALSLAADCHAQAVLVRWGKDLEWHRLTGLEFAKHALRVAPDDPEVVARALVPLWQLGENLPSVAKLADRAVALNPGSALALGVSGWVRLLMGHTAAAAEQLELSLQLDPISPDSGLRVLGLAVTRFCNGAYADAAAMLLGAIRRKPAAQMNHIVLIACQALLGDLAGAKAALADFHALSPGGDPLAWLGVFGDPAHRQIAEAAISQVLEVA